MLIQRHKFNLITVIMTVDFKEIQQEIQQGSWSPNGAESSIYKMS